MDSRGALKVIAHLQNYCLKNNIGLFIVGSVAYTGCLDNPSLFSQCDDLDCILVYNTLYQLEDCSFFKSGNLYQLAGKALESGEANMFSSKPEMEGIQVSADFISLDYFGQLADEPFHTSNSFRLKLTDTLEKMTNEYRSFYGESYIYHKKVRPYADCYLYKLPIRIWNEGECYTGALYNKFIHNPKALVEIPSMASAHKRLLAGYARHFQRCAAARQSASLMSAMLFKDRFSPQTRDFLDRLASM